MILQLSKSSKSGFTLIELLVVMAIVAILVTTAIVNSGKNPDRDVRLEKDRLTTYLREIQSKSLTTEKISGVSGKICGFGVRMSESNVQSYYVNSAGATPLDEDCSLSAYTSSSGTDLGNDFIPKIDGVSITFNGTSLFFLNPNGIIYFNGGTLPAVFTISKSGATDVTVQIEQSGNIK